jgi:hypothetical protein
LVDEVCEFHVRNIHRVESIGILHPIRPIRRVDCGGIAEDIIEPQVRSIHDIQGPERWILDEDCIIISPVLFLRGQTLTVLNENIACVPENKRHWAARLRDSLLHVIPGISLAIDSSSPIAVDVDSSAEKDYACVVILKRDWIRIVPPI